MRDATIAAALERVTGDAADLSDIAGSALDDRNSSRFSVVRGMVRSIIHWYALKSGFVHVEPQQSRVDLSANLRVLCLRLQFFPNLFTNLPVVSIEPIDLLVVQHRVVYKLGLEGHQADRLEPQKVAIIFPLLVLQVLFFDNSENGLESYAELVLLVVSGLVGEELSLLERVFLLGVDAHLDGRLVDEPVGADSVPGAVPVVEAGAQQVVPGQDVQARVGGAPWEDCAGQVDGAHENPVAEIGNVIDT